MVAKETRYTTGKSKRLVYAQRRILSLFVAAAVFVLAALGYFGSMAMRLLEEKEQGTVRIVGGATAEMLTATLVNLSQQLQLFVRMRNAISLATTTTATPPLQGRMPLFLAEARLLDGGATEFLFLRVEDKEGNLLFEEGESIGRALWEQARAQQQWFTYGETRITFLPSFPAAVLSRSLEEGGVVFGVASLQPVAASIERLLGEVGSGGVRLVGSDGNILFFVPTSTETRVFIGRGSTSAFPLPLEGVRFIVGTAPSLAAQLAETFRIGLAAVLVGVALLLFAGLFAIRRLLFVPLSQLAQVALQVGKGEFSVTVPRIPIYEFAPLTEAFRAMLAHIRRYNADLINRLQKTMEDQDRAARLLLRRDLELQEANERLRALDRQKNEFVSIAAHQLRTPLSAIRWALSLMLGGEYGPLTEAQRSVLQRAQASNNQMIALVNDLLKVDRLESGRLAFHPSKVDLCRLVDEEVRNHLANAREAGLRISLAIATKPCTMVEVDPRLFQQVLRNLIENAVKYTPRGGQVVVRVHYPDNARREVEVVVSDNGIGIPKDAQRRLFLRFFRAPNAMLQQTEGSGLGLYLAKQLLERMHGTIAVESEEGKGTTVRVRLPVASSGDA